MSTTIRHGDCLDMLPTLAADSVDACVTDPPYGLKFMGKDWDHGIPGEPYWREVSRVLKPGAHLLAFGGTRTYHRLTCAIEDAGFEIRDCLMWLHGQGFPKGKSQLKPAWEPIILARKPGKGAGLDIDGCRIDSVPNKSDGWRPKSSGKTYGSDGPVYGGGKGLGERAYNGNRHPSGRWPANVVLDEVAAALLDEQSGERIGSGLLKESGKRAPRGNPVYGVPTTTRHAPDSYGDSGGASRFFATFPSESRLDSSEHVCDNQAWENTDRSQVIPVESGTQPERAITDSTFGTAPPSQAAWCSHMSISGNKQTDPSQTATKFTTGTTTSRTTDSATCNSLTPSPTSVCIAGANCVMASGGSPVASAENSNLWTPTTGTCPERDGPCTDAAVHAISAESLPINADGVTRFLYCPKASRAERGSFNFHPTVKPLALMRWLVRLVTPSGGVVLDPFLGSGTTALACQREGFACIGIERDEHSIEIARRRLSEDAGMFADVEVSA